MIFCSQGTFPAKSNSLSLPLVPESGLWRVFVVDKALPSLSSSFLIESGPRDDCKVASHNLH